MRCHGYTHMGALPQEDRRVSNLPSLNTMQRSSSSAVQCVASQDRTPLSTPWRHRYYLVAAAGDAILYHWYQFATMAQGGAHAQARSWTDSLPRVEKSFARTDRDN
jgi:hypothetical protein